MVKVGDRIATSIGIGREWKEVTGRVEKISPRNNLLHIRLDPYFDIKKLIRHEADVRVIATWR